MLDNGSHNHQLPRDAKLQASKGYFLRFDEVSRLLHFLAERRDQSRNSQGSVMSATGLSKHHVESLISLASGMGLVLPIVYRATELGLLIHDQDLFFDDVGTLWLCHYSISSNLRYVVWNRMTNTILPRAQQPIASEVASEFADLRAKFSEKSVNKHVRKEIRALFNAYTEQQFSRVYYLKEINGRYQLRNSSALVPPLIFMCTLITYRDHFAPGASGLEIGTMCSADNSPGRLLNLREAQVRDLLDQLHRTDLLTIESRADLDQVRFGQELTVTQVLSRYYRER